MNCKDFYNNINSFLKNETPEENLEEFIEHYKACKNCNEELEIYFLAHNIYDIDEKAYGNSNERYNLKESLEKFIKEKEDIIYYNYKRDFLYSMMFWIGNIISVGLAIYFIFLIISG